DSGSGNDSAQLGMQNINNKAIIFFFISHLYRLKASFEAYILVLSWMCTINIDNIFNRIDHFLSFFVC
ncbi:hypothetical protein, partial [Photobacterium damselae]|uniref:hypothetical protein n=1 Tax=Photobacterium damselae TaxID=38293 RepID=UPI0035A83D21